MTASSGYLRQHLGFICNHDPSDFVEHSPTLKADHLRQVEEAVTVLQQVVKLQKAGPLERLLGVIRDHDPEELVERDPELAAEHLRMLNETSAVLQRVQQLAGIAEKAYERLIAIPGVPQDIREFGHHSVADSIVVSITEVIDEQPLPVSDNDIKAIKAMVRMIIKQGGLYGEQP